jgi:hypothetical protein
MHTRRIATTGPARRRGVVTVESLLSIVILLFLTLAVIAFGILVTVQNAVAHAALKGAREAGKGADIDTVVSVVDAVLSPHGIAIGPEAGVVLEDPAAMTIETRGLACTPPTEPVINGKVRVTVCVALSATPFLQQLEAFCGGGLGRLLQMSSVVKKECPG